MGLCYFITVISHGAYVAEYTFDVIMLKVMDMIQLLFIRCGEQIIRSF